MGFRETWFKVKEIKKAIQVENKSPIMIEIAILIKPLNWLRYNEVNKKPVR